MSEIATQVGPVVTRGDLQFDFGTHNQEIAYQFAQYLNNGNVTVTHKGVVL